MDGFFDGILKNFEKFKSYFSVSFLTRAFHTVIALLIFYIVYRIVKQYLLKIIGKKVKPQRLLILDKAIKYTYEILVVIYVLNLFGIELNALLGAAGIIGIAVGFAAQTSVGNIISGIFVLSDQSVKIGDFITIDEVVGTVHSIDLMSIKVLTPNNQLIRVPNETVIKSNMQNNTFFPTRRMTFSVSVSYDTDLEYAKEILQKVPLLCSTVTSHPAPLVYFDSFGESSIRMVLAVWFKTEFYWETRNAVFITIKKEFDKANITIPFNMLDVTVKNWNE